MIPEPDSKLDLMLSQEERVDIPPEAFVYTCEFCGTNKSEYKCQFCGKQVCGECGETCYYCGDISCPDCWKEYSVKGDACSRECYLEATEDYSTLEG